MPAISETYSTNGKSIAVDVYLPKGTGPFPVVLLLHGSFGLLPPYRADIESFADALQEAGMAVTMPHYLDATGAAPGMGVFDLMGTDLPVWAQAGSDLLTRLAGDGRFQIAKLGLLGFSLGGHLALRLAMEAAGTVRPLCVADFFGPTLRPPLEPHWSKLPVTLISHGTKDPLVKFAESEYLAAELAKSGKVKGRDFFFEPYEGEGHGFKGAALAKSRDRAVEFLGGVLLT